MNNNPSTVSITEVTDSKAMDTFIKVPWLVYKDDPHWVPPLIAERKDAFSPRHPYFEHAEWQTWIAWRNGQAVGRISAQIDELHQQQCRDQA